MAPPLSCLYSSKIADDGIDGLLDIGAVFVADGGFNQADEPSERCQGLLGVKVPPIQQAFVRRWLPE